MVKLKVGESRKEVINLALLLKKEELEEECNVMTMVFIIIYHDILRPKIGNFIKLMLIFSHQFRMVISKEENNQSSMHISVGSTKVQLKLTV